MQLEAGTMLDTAESRLFQDICAAVVVVLCNVVQNLERCSTYTSSQLQNTVIEINKAYR